MGIFKTRIHVKRPAILGNGPVVLPRVAEVFSSVSNEVQRDGIEFSGNLELSKGFLKTTQGIEIHCIHSVADCEARIELNGALKLAFGTVPVPVINPFHPAQ